MLFDLRLFKAFCYFTIEAHFVLLGLLRITALLAKLAWLLLPGFRRFTLFYLSVLIVAVALLGYFNKRGIDHLASFCEDTLVVKCLIETAEQCLDEFFLDQRFAENFQIA
ncbi:hypothetical protein OO006_00535 [Prosthecochloris sp. SCSIO W1101]|uniref:hypothetical protein n=1 Tax=Prosthecochloris sp. SCSIO W1101 TaxID=2992242 RepID=UPI00223CE1B5|nr:hypothetical protein [Prosthecochloris sp. SCSIO W1101]UZJ41536.1 hypothetical protein OO006_00535 [Prosthecochloris sp. SCSIO W1101]